MYGSGQQLKVMVNNIMRLKRSYLIECIKPIERMVKITCFVDASHTANKVNMKSYTGYLIFINRAPIIWHSKLQITVESSTFTSEFIALKACMERVV